MYGPTTSNPPASLPFFSNVWYIGNITQSFNTKFLVSDVTFRLNKIDLSGDRVKLATTSALDIIRKCTELRTVIFTSVPNISGLAVLKVTPDIMNAK